MRNNLFDELLDDIHAKAEIIPVLSKEDEKYLFDVSLPIPESIPILPLRGNVLFPGVVMPVNAGRKSSLKLLKQAHKKELVFGVVSQRNDVENPSLEDLFEVGTIAKVVQMVDLPNGGTMAVVQGYSRFRLGGIRSFDPFMEGFISEPLAESVEGFNGAVSRQLVASIRRKHSELMKGDHTPAEATALKSLKGERLLVNFVANHIDCDVQTKQTLLEEGRYVERARMLLTYLEQMLSAVDLKREIQNKANRVITRQQREYFLRQQMQEIQQELGGSPNDRELARLSRRADQKHWPAAALKTFLTELDKLRYMQPQMADYSVQLNYLNLMLDLPWDDCTRARIDVNKARRVLERDHYGLEKVKERILEHIAVLQMKGDLKSPILCLVGPPGTGKTSLGKSVATALGRQYVRVALGGLHDEAEIRGHRRTYVGAMPGRIIEALKKAKSSNPVFVLDEIDKVQTNTMNGDPTSALLEVLDPEQNSAFHDNYLDVDYDLSKVLFIATANSLANIQPALLDRMEVIELSGYILEEKMEIAARHLVPRQLKDHGFKRTDLIFTKPVMERLINDYTRESGVRQLDKAIAKIVRHRAVQVVSGEKVAKTLRLTDLKPVLGLPIHQSESRAKLDRIGVVTGLAWTQVGGEILFIEASTSKGKGTLSMTGNLGDVMKESATLAHEYIKANAAALDISDEMLENLNIHIHVPEGATPKDGPSAGITMFTAMVSAITRRKVRAAVAMTGEITLRGEVTPVGGIKEKILAAKRAEITDLVLSEDNRRDIEDIQPDYLQGLSFHYIHEMSEVLPIVMVE